jgi:hypothetical protein
VGGVLAVVSALMAIGLIGIAVMLGVLHGSFHWVLVAVPAIAVLIAAVGAYIAWRPTRLSGFDDLRAQLEADVQALHLAGDLRAR